MDDYCCKHELSPDLERLTFPMSTHLAGVKIKVPVFFRFYQLLPKINQQCMPASNCSLEKRLRSASWDPHQRIWETEAFCLLCLYLQKHQASSHMLPSSSLYEDPSLIFHILVKPLKSTCFLFKLVKFKLLFNCSSPPLCLWVCAFYSIFFPPFVCFHDKIFKRNRKKRGKMCAFIYLGKYGH